MANLVSINVGLPKDVEWRGQRVHTGIWKNPVQGRCFARRLNLAGDGQGDLAGHGGEHRAVFVYQTSAYAFWAQKLQRTDFTFGQFGENFTVEGLPDDEVRIGDRYRIGDAIFEVTQPRVTCYRVGIRMNDPLMPARLVAESRPGFYLRVIVEGEVGAGDAIEMIGRDANGVTVADVDALLYRPHPNLETVDRALKIAALSPGWRGSLEAIRSAPGDAPGARGLATADLAPLARAGFRPARIADLTPVARDVIAVSLAATDSGALDRPQPGQFIVVKTPASVNAPPIIRSYSLTADANAGRYTVAVKCERNGSMGTYLSQRAHVGDTLEISAPRGSFVLANSERAAVFMSAGIGITPVIAMLKSLAAARSQRRVWWLYGARNVAEHPFADEVRTIVKRLPQARTHIRYSQPASSDRQGADFDSVGHLDAQLVRDLEIPLDSEFYLCGPSSFLQDVQAGLTAAGAPSANVRSETFGAGPALAPGIVGTKYAPPHVPAGAPGLGPQVSFARSGVDANWSTRYTSLLELAEACDVPTRWSCRVGVCHTCESGLISGQVSYQLEPIQPPAAGNCLPCCALPVGDIVLDL